MRRLSASPQEEEEEDELSSGQVNQYRPVVQ